MEKVKMWKFRETQKFVGLTTKKGRQNFCLENWKFFCVMPWLPVQLATQIQVVNLVWLCIDKVVFPTAFSLPQILLIRYSARELHVVNVDLLYLSLPVYNSKRSKKVHILVLRSKYGPALNYLCDLFLLSFLSVSLIHPLQYFVRLDLSIHRH